MYIYIYIYIYIYSIWSDVTDRVSASAPCLRAERSTSQDIIIVIIIIIIIMITIIISINISIIITSMFTITITNAFTILVGCRDGRSACQDVLSMPRIKATYCFPSCSYSMVVIVPNS